MEKNRLSGFGNKITEESKALTKFLKPQPDLIIIGRPSEELKIKGYKSVDVFLGKLYWKNRTKERNDFALFSK